MVSGGNRIKREQQNRFQMPFRRPAAGRIRKAVKPAGNRDHVQERKAYNEDCIDNRRK